MISQKPLRVMWLLNHTTLRNFEIQQLLRLGIKEIFLPKNFPYDEGNLSASICTDHDAQLGLNADEIELLNAQNWYGEPSKEAWELANRYFDVVFIGFFPRQIMSSCLNFKGAIVLRAFGLGGEETYSKLLYKVGGASLVAAVSRVGKKFWFGMGYEHLRESEEAFVDRRSVYMPVGMKNAQLSDVWEGNDRLVFFVCPRIGSSPYFKRVYTDFLKVFNDIPYRIGGAQPIPINDSRVLGFLSNSRYAEVMKQSRVMFYHSQEPNHIHYHPFEAIRVGMPLVFMAGGMLDLLGGKNLPGRCRDFAEARRKVERILAGDEKLIASIKASQPVLLSSMEPENCEGPWSRGFQRVAAELASWRSEQSVRPQTSSIKKIAVILPVGYRGGSLRGAFTLAKALKVGSQQSNANSDIVFAHLDDPASYTEEEFNDLSPDIARRPYQWKILKPAEARRAMRYAGYENWEPLDQDYMAPDDGMQQMLDCSVWVVVSDRLPYPIIPLRPLVLMVYDYLQRYENILSHGADTPFLDAARSAERVLVTTEFAKEDALQYAGVEPRRVVKVPMLAPEFPIERERSVFEKNHRPYFVWTTNAARHKNHKNAAEALLIYYTELDGRLNCRVTGVNTGGMLSSALPHLQQMSKIFQQSKVLSEKVIWMGELPDMQYRKQLRNAEFLWHAGRIDNGTFSVIEAACSGVPALSSDYPAMREIDKQFSLNLLWMDSDSPQNMAQQLKTMELETHARVELLPTEEQLKCQRVEAHAMRYWQEVAACM